jgi:membrane-associated phospholipid phosphatase
MPRAEQHWGYDVAAAAVVAAIAGLVFWLVPLELT